ncbi:uncharacterized protein LOC131303337 [Rhododendron vialii]|uniref:uncharacterized protein LOC131303337 n=1 Tax=Rhododendron vialii TaxID=182163 RepID=UPI00265FEEA5|nr:uncharacterized protein LOC131303337 [Rhododendron vialii]
MMSNKKMKGVALDSSSYGQFEVSKAIFKHQTLIQDYQELHKEADDMKNKLETMKLRKLTLLAEVRFLRRRYNYLVTAKPPQRQGLVQKQNFETQGKKAAKEKNHSRKDANKKEKISIAKEYARRNQSPVLDLNSKDRIHGGKEASLRYRTPASDLNQKDRMYGGKQTNFRNRTPTLDLNQTESLYSRQESTRRNQPQSFDLNQMERSYIGRENVAQNRAPVFDLNQISGEEESQDIYEPLRIEKSTKKSIGGGADDHLNDLNLSACRNLGNGPNRVGKRKISWQDQVALKV